MSEPRATADQTPIVSVVVSTYQRAASLPLLVAALEAQTLPRDQFEVVIADNGSTDATADVLRGLVEASQLDIRVVRATRNRGPAAGRNLAWRAGRGAIVAFTDDDCRPLPGWLAAGLDAMEESRIVVGHTRPPPDQELLTAGAFARTLWVSEPRFFETCNIFYRRADLESADGFDEGFLTPGGEDTDLALRVAPDETGVSYAPDAVVYHDVRASDFGAAARETLRWVDIPRVIRLHPDRRAALLYRGFFWRPAHPPMLLAMAGMALAAGRWSPRPLLLALPWVRYRVRVRPLCPGPRRRWLVLPAAFVLDALEVLVMARGSLRHRALVL